MSARGATGRPGDCPAGRRYHITLPGHPLSPNKAAAAGLRVRLRDKREWREAVAWEARKAHRGAPLERAHVTITLVRTDGQFYDTDNAYGTVKHVVDGLCVQHGGTLLVDDDSAHLELVVRQGHGPRRCVEITVQEVTG